MYAKEKTVGNLLNTQKTDIHKLVRKMLEIICKIFVT